jgi:hypothetical protein
MARSGLMPIGAAASDLGLGDMLGQQVQDETDEQRRKRLQQLRDQQMLGPAGSLAATSLFGPRGIPGAGY